MYVKWTLDILVDIYSKACMCNLNKTDTSFNYVNWEMLINFIVARVWMLNVVSNLNIVHHSYHI